MPQYEIRVRVEADAEPSLHPKALEAILHALRQTQPELLLKAVSVGGFEEASREIAMQRMEKLRGRSKLIVRFLLDNPGRHSTDEIKEYIELKQPFRSSSILHSYLTNLSGRGIISKIDHKWYEIPN